MIVAKTNQELQVGRQNLPGSVGLVMTMGALHEGHLSLVRLARQHADHVVVSIFVNPTQFSAGEDFAQYPRTLSDDLALLEAENVEIVYAPEASDVYPAQAYVGIDPGVPASVLEGRSRPGHFAGVCQVVLKFMNRIRPNIAVFGQKDAQQLAVLQQMAADLDVPVKILGAKIVRDSDGLALSSRNRYLSVEQRQIAVNLHRALQAGKQANEQTKAQIGGQTSEQTSKRTSEQTKAQATVQISGYAKVQVDEQPSLQTSEQTSRQTNERASEQTNEHTESEPRRNTPEVILRATTAVLESIPEISVDYVALATVKGFEVVADYVTKPKQKLTLQLDKLGGEAVDCYLLVAAKVGQTRLIDNLIIEGVKRESK